MIMLVCLALSLIIGYVRGGRLSHYLHAPLRGVLLPIVAYALEFSFDWLETWLPWPPSVWLGPAVCVEYALILAFVWLNRSRDAFWLIALSSLCNFAAIAANGFRMPISPIVYEHPLFEGIVERVGAGEMVEYVLVGWDAPLWWLGDTIPVLWGIPGLASLGDLGIAVGMFQLIQEIMCPKRHAGHGRDEYLSARERAQMRARRARGERYD